MSNDFVLICLGDYLDRIFVDYFQQFSNLFSLKCKLREAFFLQDAWKILLITHWKVIIVYICIITQQLFPRKKLRLIYGTEEPVTGSAIVSPGWYSRVMVEQLE